MLSLPTFTLKVTILDISMYSERMISPTKIPASPLKLHEVPITYTRIFIHSECCTLIEGLPILKLDFPGVYPSELIIKGRMAMLNRRGL
jgi:hypothetical protein